MKRLSAPHTPEDASQFFERADFGMGGTCGAAKLANSKGRKLNFVDRWGRSMTHCKHFAMKRLHRLSLSEQTAAHLRDGLREGRWRWRRNCPAASRRLADFAGAAKVSRRRVPILTTAKLRGRDTRHGAEGAGEGAVVGEATFVGDF